jgi:hypothetical protein
MAEQEEPRKRHARARAPSPSANSVYRPTTTEESFVKLAPGTTLDDIGALTEEQQLAIVLRSSEEEADAAARWRAKQRETETPQHQQFLELSEDEQMRRAMKLSLLGSDGYAGFFTC